ncbi:MAG: hypothetical protein JNL67_03825 [Planctomycetaceae bacterium]|nr:hypothetical protein [Planctomycetaceae bacterium]
MNLNPASSDTQTPKGSPETVAAPATPSPEDMATAYHEAGHAVVALALGRAVEKLSIVRNSLRLGAVNFGNRRSGRRQDYFETEAMILLAGIVSEAKVTGKMNWEGARQDLGQLERMVSQRVEKEKAAERMQRRLLDKTEHLLSQTEIWSAVERIAHHLLEHRAISGRAARHLFDEAMK